MVGNSQCNECEGVCVGGGGSLWPSALMMSEIKTIIHPMYSNPPIHGAHIVCLFVLRLNVPVNNFSVMSGRSQRFLGLTSTVGSRCALLKDTTR